MIEGIPEILSTLATASLLTASLSVAIYSFVETRLGELREAGVKETQIRIHEMFKDFDSFARNARKKEPTITGIEEMSKKMEEVEEDLDRWSTALGRLTPQWLIWFSIGLPVLSLFTALLGMYSLYESQVIEAVYRAFWSGVTLALSYIVIILVLGSIHELVSISASKKKKS